MDIGIMKTYESKTGYVRNKLTKGCYEAKTIYLGIYDSADNYEDISASVYGAFLKSGQKKMEDALKARR